MDTGHRDYGWCDNPGEKSSKKNKYNQCGNRKKATGRRKAKRENTHRKSNANRKNHLFKRWESFSTAQQ